jgi:Pyruvate/2-oxoacid:ferredoxin oxidoreductase delta subunit
MTPKDLYRKLGKKIDGLSARVPWTESFYEILKELYTEEEADLVVRMPYTFSTVEQIEELTGYKRDRVRGLLDNLCDKGLVIDILWPGGYRYVISPLVIGIFEFTMMRTGENLDYRKWARLFQDYLHDDGVFYRANFENNEKVMPLRALPHEGTIDDSEYVEVLDYEKATAIVGDAEKFAVGMCSCRHKKLHLGEKCDAPLEVCSTIGGAADHMLSHNFAREISKSEMLENLARSKEMGLVFCADNVKRNVSFICQCCGCCCIALAGISKFGYPNAVVTSNYIARCDTETCAECGDCAEACPIDAIEMIPDGGPEIDTSFCLGCGVCALKCSTESMMLHKREQRVLHPENFFEKIILQSLERGTLQNLIFSNPRNLTHKFMRGFVGGFLKLPPVKRSLMSDTLRSRFLSALRKSG